MRSRFVVGVLPHDGNAKTVSNIKTPGPAIVPGILLEAFVGYAIAVRIPPAAMTEEFFGQFLLVRSPFRIGRFA